MASVDLLKYYSARLNFFEATLIHPANIGHTLFPIFCDPRRDRVGALYASAFSRDPISHRRASILLRDITEFFRIIHKSLPY